MHRVVVDTRWSLAVTTLRGAK